jgi:hypothetical protein
MHVDLNIEYRNADRYIKLLYIDEFRRHSSEITKLDFGITVILGDEIPTKFFVKAMVT